MRNKDIFDGLPNIKPVSLEFYDTIRSSEEELYKQIDNYSRALKMLILAANFSIPLRPGKDARFARVSDVMVLYLPAFLLHSHNTDYSSVMVILRDYIAKMRQRLEVLESNASQEIIRLYQELSV